MTSPAPVPKAPIGSLRALWPFVRRHFGLFIAWLGALAVSSTATLSLPVAFRQMIDHGFSSGANIDRTFGFVLVVILVLALATAARFFFVTLLGERVVAFAVARDGVTGEELRNFCAANLSDYKVPDQVHVVEGPLPRNPNGKLLKTALRDWLADYSA